MWADFTPRSKNTTDWQLEQQRERWTPVRLSDLGKEPSQVVMGLAKFQETARWYGYSRCDKLAWGGRPVYAPGLLNDLSALTREFKFLQGYMRLVEGITVLDSYAAQFPRLFGCGYMGRKTELDNAAYGVHYDPTRDLWDWQPPDAAHGGVILAKNFEALRPAVQGWVAWVETEGWF